MDKRRYLFLAAAVALVVVAYLASRSGDEPATEVADTPEVTFPRQQPKKRQKKARPGQRVKNAPLDTQRSGTRGFPPAHDAVEAAVSGIGGDGVVIEFNAIRNSPLAEKVLRCREGEAMQAFKKFQTELGLDLERDVDRLAFGGKVFVASGYFDKLTLPEEMGEGEAFGDDSTLYETTNSEGNDVHVARMSNDMVMMSTDREELESAIRRARGEEESAPMKYSGNGGELYGHVTPAFLGKMLQSVSPGAASQLAGLVDNGLI